MSDRLAAAHDGHVRLPIPHESEQVFGVSSGIWSREFSCDYTLRMTGLSRFLDIDADRADATVHEPICRGRDYVGYVTSGGYGHCVGRSLAMGYVSPAVAAAAGELSVTLLGESRPARLVPQVLIDPDGARMRG